jgi:hypothetical protein
MGDVGWDIFVLRRIQALNPPRPAPTVKIVRNPHPHHSAHAREAVDRHADDRAIPLNPKTVSVLMESSSLRAWSGLGTASCHASTTYFGPGTAARHGSTESPG